MAKINTTTLSAITALLGAPVSVSVSVCVCVCVCVCVGTAAFGVWRPRRYAAIAVKPGKACG